MCLFNRIQLLVYKHSIEHLEVELTALACHEGDLNKGTVAMESRFITCIDKGGIECLHAILVQTVVGEVLHLLVASCGGVHIGELVSIVGDGYAPCIHLVKAGTTDDDLHLLALADALGSNELKLSSQCAHAIGVNTTACHDTYRRDVVGIDKAVLVDVASADISVKVGVSSTQTSVVHV